jgi:hypothetical protein
MRFSPGPSFVGLAILGFCILLGVLGSCAVAGVGIDADPATPNRVIGTGILVGLAVGIAAARFYYRRH